MNTENSQLVMLLQESNQTALPFSRHLTQSQHIGT